MLYLRKSKGYVAVEFDYRTRFSLITREKATAEQDDNISTRDFAPASVWLDFENEKAGFERKK